jgi:hypothetical protein
MRHYKRERLIPGSVSSLSWIIASLWLWVLARILPTWGWGTLLDGPVKRGRAWIYTLISTLSWMTCNMMTGSMLWLLMCLRHLQWLWLILINLLESMNLNLILRFFMHLMSLHLNGGYRRFIMNRASCDCHLVWWGRINLRAILLLGKFCRGAILFWSRAMTMLVSLKMLMLDHGGLSWYQFSELIIGNNMHSFILMRVMLMEASLSLVVLTEWLIWLRLKICMMLMSGILKLLVKLVAFLAREINPYGWTIGNLIRISFIMLWLKLSQQTLLHGVIKAQIISIFL